MDPKDRELLEKTFEYAEENNKLLKRIRLSIRLSGLFRILYWLVIIAVAFGLFYYLEPIISSVLDVRSNFGSLNNIENLLQSEPVFPEPEVELEPES
jgi:hypothetical protein